MVDQYSENQYDDDLTVGADEYEEYEYDHTDAVDLFEFSNQDESPTSRLKSLILSIDWEITDEVLMQFNEELVYLEELWAGQKIHLVYVQALQSISKYIYQQKANSHPNAIKLLLKFYYNLEKIVSSEDLSSDEKKDILIEDVKRFESLKRQISQHTRDRMLSDSKGEDQSLAEQQINENELLNLKATVLGIDWEITEEDLSDLRQEVVRLEEKYAESRPKLILLQGIGTLGAYIKAHKSNAHGDSFKLLHLFFESLEEMVKTPMSLEEEKAVLFPTIEKFNSFKALVGSTISPDVAHEEEEDEGIAESTGDTETIQPALAGYEEEQTRGFQEEEEARDLGSEGLGDVSSHIDDFFAEDPEDSIFHESDQQAASDRVEEELAIQGVDVDRDDTDAADTDADDGVEGEPESFEGILAVDKDLALQGVDVETDADDDSDEDALPMEDSGVLAPALGESDEASLYSVDSLSAPAVEGSVDEKIHETLDDFFVDEEPDEQQAAAEEDSLFDDVSTGVDASRDAVVGLEESTEETEEEEVVFELVTPSIEADGQQTEDEEVPEQVLVIGRYIDDLNQDFDEKIVEGIALEIGRLQQFWSGRTLEMSLLQLLATVTRHIDRFRFDSDPEAYELLQSNYAALEKLEEGMSEQNQEVLFNEITKVLKWQQDLLLQQIMPE